MLELRLIDPRSIKGVILKQLALATILFFFTLTLPQAYALNPLPGLIPLGYSGRPSVDLLYEGKNITPEEIHQLVLRHDGEFDHSFLLPMPSDLWQNISQPADSAEDTAIPLEYMETVEYLSPVLSRSGNFRFNITKTNEAGIPQIFTILISKKSHNILLRRGLLRKVGYKIPAIKHLNKLQLRFQSEEAKKLFLNQLAEATFGAPDRWVTRDREGELTLTMQDMIAMEDINAMYNLAVGLVPREIVQGRRVLRSLLVPYSLTDIPESVNLFDWSAGRIISNNVLLPYENAQDYDTTFEDARWLTNRILKLKRSDWEDIVRGAHFPKSVEMLALEKLIARRNSLGQLLKLDTDELPYNPQISYGEDLVNGEIKKEFFDGHGARYSFGDPENPLSSSEVTSFIAMEGITTALMAAMTALNSIPYLGTNLDDQMLARQERLAAEAAAQSITSGETVSQNLGAFVFPTARARFNLSRKVVAGTYLGTNNRIQLVDSIGVSGAAGIYVGIEGLPTMISAGASAQIAISRNYAHVKPIFSIKKALRYPFKNILVPLMKRKYGRYFKELFEVDLNTLPPDEKAKRIDNALALFKENMEIGESIIVSDTLAAQTNFNIGVNYMKLLAANVGISPSEIVVFRLHIHRKSENQIQIYRDFGNLHQLGLGISLRAGVPIITARTKFSAGTAKSKFLTLNIDPNNPAIVETLGALRHVFFNNSLERAEKVEKPFIAKYKFSENSQALGLLIWRYDRLNSSNNITINHPQGDTIKLYYKYRGHTFGTDPVGFATEALTALPSIFLKNDYVPPAVSSGNPGNNYFGKAKNKISTFESILDEEGKVTQPFLKYSIIWNGFSSSRKKALKILNEVKDRYKFNFYPKTVLNEADKLYLYNISVNFLVYHTGIQHMFNLPDKEIERIFKNTQNKKRVLLSGHKRFIRLKKKYHSGREKNSKAKMGNATTRAVKLMEDKLTLAGLSEMVGGDANLYVYSKVEGFRVGDENGDTPYLSNSLGEFGEEDLAGPLAKIQRYIGMTEGEFYISWLMGRLL